MKDFESYFKSEEEESYNLFREYHRISTLLKELEYRDGIEFVTPEMRGKIKNLIEERKKEITSRERVLRKKSHSRWKFEARCKIVLYFAALVLSVLYVEDFVANGFKTSPLGYTIMILGPVAGLIAVFSGVAGFNFYGWGLYKLYGFYQRFHKKNA